MFRDFGRMILLVLIVSNVTLSCVQPKKELDIKLPEPKVKTEYSVVISIISNLSYPFKYDLGVVKKYLEQFVKFQNVPDDLFIDQNLLLGTNTLTNFYQLSELSYTNQVNSINVSDETNKIRDKSTVVDLDKLVVGTIERNFSRFVSSLGRYVISEHEIEILNLQEIEKQVVNKILQENLKDYTNYIYLKFLTNEIFETNFYRLPSYITNLSSDETVMKAITSGITDSVTNIDTNYVLMEVIEKLRIVEERKISNEVLMDYLKFHYPWIFKATNVSKFSLSSQKDKGDFSFSFYYSLTNVPDDRSIKGLIITLWIIVSNNVKNTFFVYRTNVDIRDFLTGDYRFFDGIKPSLYGYRVGSLSIELDEDWDVYLDDFFLGTGKVFVPFVMSGYHKITYSKWNITIDEKILVKEGEVNILKKSLRTSEKLGKVYFDPLPKGSKIFLESFYLGESPTNVILPYGSYRVWFKKDNLSYFGTLEVSNYSVNFSPTLYDVRDHSKYEILTALTTFMGITSGIGILLYFWSSEQQRFYNELYINTKDPKVKEMYEYYYYFTENMRSASITFSILTFITWGVTLGIESGKFLLRVPF